MPLLDFGGILGRACQCGNDNVEKASLPKWQRLPLGLTLEAAVHVTALRYFLEVARTGSINAASERLRVAGSAVSRQITGLEHKVGAPLFERKARGMALTAAGEKLADFARRSFLEADRIVAEIRGKAGEPRGTVRIATSEGLATHFVPEVIHAYRSRFPEMRFVVLTLPPAEIAASVREGDVDFGLGFGSGGLPGIRAAYRFRVPMCAIVAADHPLASRTHVRLADVAPYPVATSSGTTVRRVIDLRCAAEGVELDNVFLSNYSASLFNFAKLGGGVTFAARISVRRWIDDGELVAVPLDESASFDRTLEVKVMEGHTLRGPLQDAVEFFAAEMQRQLDIAAA